MTPILYNSTETAFHTNGLGALADCVSCFVEREVNGIYELEMRYPLDGRRYGDIQERSLILAKPDPYSDPQPFRVYRITAPMRGTVTVYARHIAYDLIGIPVSPFKALTTPAAMQGLADNAAVTCPFTFSTDKETVADMTVSVPKSIWSQLGGSEGSVLDVYGGEYDFDRFQIKLLKRLGADRGVTIRYGKNLTSLEQDRNCAEVYTGVYPYWKGSDGALVTLPEWIIGVDGSFDYVRILALDLSEAFEEAPTVAQLRARAKTYIKANNIGVPDVSWTISFVQLERTEEYRGKALLEKVQLGDTVTVIFPKMGVNVSARAVKTRYNVLLDRYESVTLGKVRANISDTIADNSQKILIESQKRVSADGKLSAELAVQDGKIAAKVEKIGGTPESFGWDLASDSWTLTATGKVVLKATKYGIDVTGRIVALSGKIANWDILEDSLSYNGQTWGGTKTVGAYLGKNGFQLGTDCRIDMSGHAVLKSAVLESADVKGTLRAGDIIYGGDAGYFDGGGLESSSVTGGKVASRTLSGGNIGYSTLTTSNTNSGINASLSNADDAYDVVTGNRKADIMLVDAMYTSILTASTFVYRGSNAKWKSISVGSASYTVLAMEDN